MVSDYRMKAALCSKRKVRAEKEGKGFTKPKSTTTIKGQKVSEAGEVDEGGQRSS